MRRLDSEQPVPGVLVIALEEHVDYWDRLGWRDAFSSKAFTTRQSDYARAFGRRDVYTPQLVIDGVGEIVGGDYKSAQRAIERAAESPKVAVTIYRAARAFRLRVDPAARSADVFLAIVEDGLRSDVTRGENAGRTLEHRGVVRSLRRAGTVGERPFTAQPRIELDRAWKRDRLRLVVFAQDRESRRVLGASVVPLEATTR